MTSGEIAEIETDILLQAIVSGYQFSLTFSPVDAGGSLTTWCSSGTMQFGPDVNGRAADPVGTTHWLKLHRLVESIQAVVGLDGLDEANLRLVQMDPVHADWRAMVLESVWYDVGRAA